MSCDTLLLLGCDFAWRQFYPEKARIIQVDVEPTHLGRRRRRRQSDTLISFATPNRTHGSRVSRRQRGTTYEGHRNTWQACGDQSWGKDSPAVSCQSY